MSVFASKRRVADLAALPSVHRAFQWFHLQEMRLRQWQAELVSIPAPPFHEAARADWFQSHFRELGLAAVTRDPAGNVLGYLRPPAPGEPFVLLSAHLDTVFPHAINLHTVQDGAILRAPGATDNGAGLAALLAIVAAIRHAGIETATNILFAANVGEEAEGDLRGMRQMLAAEEVRARVIAAVALEGAGTAVVVTRGLGSRRFRITLEGPGGHSWTDSAVPNPVVVLAGVVASLGQAPLPSQPRTVINTGRICGGTSVTGIPQSAEALVDIRSVDGGELLRCEVLLYRTVEDAVLAANHAVPEEKHLHSRIEVIGDRPAGELPAHSPLLQSVRAVDRHLRLRTEERIGSTDANLPIALGMDALAVGAGGSGGGIHTTAEWFDATGRDLALRRVLLVLLDAAGREFAELSRTRPIPAQHR